jgi:hypothetical protein
MGSTGNSKRRKENRPLKKIPNVNVNGNGINWKLYSKEGRKIDCSRKFRMSNN